MYHCFGFFSRALERIAYDSQAPEAMKATNQSEAADLMAQSALNSIDDILHELPRQVDQARKLPRDVEDTNKVTSQVATFLKSEFETISFMLERLFNHTCRNREKKTRVSQIFMSKWFTFECSTFFF